MFLTEILYSPASHTQSHNLTSSDQSSWWNCLSTGSGWKRWWDGTCRTSWPYCEYSSSARVSVRWQSAWMIRCVWIHHIRDPLEREESKASPDLLASRCVHVFIRTLKSPKRDRSSPSFFYCCWTGSAWTNWVPRRGRKTRRSGEILWICCCVCVQHLQPLDWKRL